MVQQPHARYHNEEKVCAKELFKHYGNASKTIWTSQLTGTSSRESNPLCGGDRNCNLCMSEKLTIIQSEPKYTLNKRSEILGKCRHRNKFILKHAKNVIHSIRPLICIAAFYHDDVMLFIIIGIFILLSRESVETLYELA